MMLKKFLRSPSMLYAILLLLVIASISFIIWTQVISKVEQPRYDILKEQNNIQLRKYNEMIVAQVEVIGGRKEAIKEGFNILADYILGGNEEKKSLNMTAPVMQQLVSGRVISKDVKSKNKEAKVWQVRFVMPSSFKLDELPKPHNENIKFIKVTSHKSLVVTFSGMVSDSNISSHIGDLKAYAKANKIKLLGEPIIAFYNPPWTLPFLRKNEVIFLAN
jgi:hypothetical protein